MRRPRLARIAAQEVSMSVPDLQEHGSGTHRGQRAAARLSFAKPRWRDTMNYRPKGICLVLAIFGSVLMACGGDDEAAGTGNQVTAGETARNLPPVPARTGSAGSGTGVLGNQQMCPMTEAEATGTCTPSRGNCPFGERVCDCSNETMSWACWAPSDCPTTVPAEQSECSVVGMSCSPARGDNCSCTAQGWNCGNQVCPAAEPSAGSACEEGDGQCTFGARTCECEDDVWACWNPATDCPAAPPLDDASCTIIGISCEYEGGSCDCEDSGWQCGRRVMNDPPEEDAGVPEGTAGASGSGPATGGAGASAAGAGAAGQSGAGAGGTAAAAGTGGEAAAGTGGAP
jgi:hypothetical protein